ncbi:unnamed protein product [Oncorhynchus mykiss]|uniref:Uncharacterized protein n=1 Tax=Oncorhynchus mykiss TaxID=8022 RepID=A0A060Y2W8_ONCMY|nr:unnamed protein product [Oncorhynchus mykiss]
MLQTEPGNFTSQEIKLCPLLTATFYGGATISEYTSTAMLMVPSSTSPPNPNSTATSGGHAHRFQIHCLQMAQTQHHHRRFPGPFVNKVKRLNVTHDCDLSFEPHIKNITWTGFFHIRNISRLRPSRSHSITETLIHAFGPSRLDYCNTPYWYSHQTHQQTSTGPECCCTNPHLHQIN